MVAATPKGAPRANFAGKIDALKRIGDPYAIACLVERIVKAQKRLLIRFNEADNRSRGRLLATLNYRECWAVAVKKGDFTAARIFNAQAEGCIMEAELAKHRTMSEASRRMLLAELGLRAGVALEEVLRAKL